MICFFSTISEISPVFAFRDICDTTGATCINFDSASATDGYRFSMGARINVTGVSAPSNPTIRVTTSDNPNAFVDFPMTMDSTTAYLGAVSGLPTYMMIDNVASCYLISNCDPFYLQMNQPAISSTFTVTFINAGQPIVTSHPQTVTAPTDGTIVSNPYQPYKNVRAACVSPGTWDATSGFCTNWRTNASPPSSALQIPFTAGSVTATYKWTCASNPADQLASGFTKDFPCNLSATTKDVYVEIDYMKNHKPDNSVILDLINSFLLHGINLHVQLDEQIPYKQYASGPINNADSSDFTILKNAYFGTYSERHIDQTASNAYCGGTTNFVQCEKNLLTAKRQVFHYVLFGDQQTINPASSGVSEGVNVGNTAYAANDIFITLGQWNYKKGSASQMESTLMHELGHNLGLNHGGPYALENVNQEPADVNCKPNYLSVMSYTRQFPTLVPDRDLTYSSDGRYTNNNPPFGSLTNDIDESDVSEKSVSSLHKSTAYFFNQANPALSAWLTTMADDPDWNNNGITKEQNIGISVLHANSLSGSPSMFPVPTPGGTRTSIPVDCGSSNQVRLYAYNDWASLGYNIWGSSSAYDGAGNGPIPTQATILPFGVRP